MTKAWTVHSGGGSQPRAFGQGSVADRQALPAGRPGSCVVRWRASGQGSGAGSGTAAAHHRGGLLAAAGGTGTLDRTAADRRGDPAQAGSTRRAGDHTSAARKPRSEAVAGKKCGAWRSWMRSTSPAWRTCWGCMKDRSREVSRWFVSTRSRRCCMKIHAPQFPCGLDELPGATTNTSDAEPPKRCGTANVFCGVEHKAGRHFTKVTPTRCSAEFADYLLKIAARYPAAHTIHLVMDNLSTHTPKALVERFGDTAGTWLCDRFTVHYTPKHGSWLNQAEMEISMFSRQCLGKRRIEDIAALRKQARAWNRRVNQDKATIQWKFTPRQARRTLNYTITRSKH